MVKAIPYVIEAGSEGWNGIRLEILPWGDDLDQVYIWMDIEIEWLNIDE